MGTNSTATPQTIILRNSDALQSNYPAVYEVVIMSTALNICSSKMQRAQSHILWTVAGNLTPSPSQRNLKACTGS